MDKIAFVLAVTSRVAGYCRCKFSVSLMEKVLHRIGRCYKLIWHSIYYGFLLTVEGIVILYYASIIAGWLIAFFWVAFLHKNCKVAV